jgi:hypothetical protein
MPTRRISEIDTRLLVLPSRKGSGHRVDDKLKGFGVIVYPTGFKTYVAQYRKDSRSHRIVLGKRGRLTPSKPEERRKRC